MIKQRLNKKTISEIKKARKNIKKGNVYTEAEAKELINLHQPILR